MARASKPARAAKTQNNIPKPRVAKMAKAPAPAGPMFYNEQGKPDPKGLYDKEGYMVKVPGKRTSFKPGPRERSAEELAAARRAGYNR